MFVLHPEPADKGLRIVIFLLFTCKMHFVKTCINYGNAYQAIRGFIENLFIFFSLSEVDFPSPGTGELVPS